MDDVSATPQEMALGIYMLVILLGGLVCTVRQMRRDDRQREAKLPAWRVGWVDFFTVLWALCLGFLLAYFFVNAVFSKILDVPGDSTLTRASYGATLPLGLMLTILVGYRFFPGLFSLTMSPRPLSWWQGVKSGGYFFLIGIFLVWTVSLAWQGAVTRVLGKEAAELPLQAPVEMLQRADSPFGLILLIALAVIAAPLAEELVFRGFFYRFGKRLTSPLLAAAGSSVLFALVHAHTLSFLPLFLLSMVLCKAYESTQSMKTPIVLHALFNLNSVLLILFAPTA